MPMGFSSIFSRLSSILREYFMLPHVCSLITSYQDYINYISLNGQNRVKETFILIQCDDKIDELLRSWVSRKYLMLSMLTPGGNAAADGNENRLTNQSSCFDDNSVGFRLIAASVCKVWIEKLDFQVNALNARKWRENVCVCVGPSALTDG